MRVLKKLKDKVTYFPVGVERRETLQQVSNYHAREKCIDSRLSCINIPLSNTNQGFP